MRSYTPLVLVLLLASCATAPAGTGGGLSSSSAAASLPSQLGRVYESAEGYSIAYPDGWDVRENATLNLPDTARTGTSFSPPPAFGKGTTFDDAAVQVASESGACAGSGTLVTVGTTPFTRSSWSDAGAGNLYEGADYATKQGGRCVHVTLYMHSCNLGPDCGPGHDKPFDRLPLRTVFEQMVSTLTLR
jgi:hypothetical protein